MLGDNNSSPKRSRKGTVKKREECLGFFYGGTKPWDIDNKLQLFSGRNPTDICIENLSE
jgi:hypothetical protein